MMCYFARHSSSVSRKETLNQPALLPGEDIACRGSSERKTRKNSDGIRVRGGETRIQKQLARNRCSSAPAGGGNRWSQIRLKIVQVIVVQAIGFEAIGGADVKTFSDLMREGHIQLLLPIDDIRIIISARLQRRIRENWKWIHRVRAITSEA